MTNRQGKADISTFKNELHIYFQHPSFKQKILSYNDLKELGFTLREIEILTGVSKSQISRELKGDS